MRFIKLQQALNLHIYSNFPLISLFIKIYESQIKRLNHLYLNHMKKYLLFSAVFLISLSAISQQVNMVYDSLLVRKLVADEYGMKNYVLVILKTGPTILAPGAKRDSRQDQQVQTLVI